MQDKKASLSQLISDSGLSLKINLDNSSKSILEDLDYRYAVAALSVEFLGKQSGDFTSIDISMLSFGQFIATRPYLISKVRNYIERKDKKQIGFEEFLGFPRGYIKDFVFKDSMYIIICAGMMDFAKQDVQTIEVPNQSSMITLAKNLIMSKRLLDEQEVLIELKELKVPKYVILWQ